MNQRVITTSLNSFTLNHNYLYERETLECLKDYGICVLPGYVSKILLEKLNLEFDAIHQCDDTTVEPFDYSNGKGARLNLSDVRHEKFPHTYDLFKNDEFKNIAQNYLGNHDLNKDIYVVNDVVGTSHIANDLHFDVMRTFKFFVYLTKTTEQNGAFKCVPGTVRETRLIRIKYGERIGYDNRELSRELPTYKYDHPIPIEGEEGTLIIFDTDTWHQAGTVLEGQRRVMRGHTRAKNLSFKKNSAFSRISSLFNLK